MNCRQLTRRCLQELTSLMKFSLKLLFLTLWMTLVHSYTSAGPPSDANNNGAGTLSYPPPFAHLLSYALSVTLYDSTYRICRTSQPQNDTLVRTTNKQTSTLNTSNTRHNSEATNSNDPEKHVTFTMYPLHPTDWSDPAYFDIQWTSFWMSYIYCSQANYISTKVQQKTALKATRLSTSQHMWNGSNAKLENY